MPLLNAPLRVVLFVMGLFFLFRLFQAGSKIMRLIRLTERHWQSAAGLMVPRGERALELAWEVQASGAQTERAEAVRAAYHRAQEAKTRPERILAEQELSHWTLTLAHAAARDPLLSTRGDLSDILAELPERENLLAAARERYNETAAALNTERYAFPGGLLIRAVLVEPAPLFESVEV